MCRRRPVGQALHRAPAMTAAQAAVAKAVLWALLRVRVRAAQVRAALAAPPNKPATTPRRWGKPAKPCPCTNMAATASMPKPRLGFGIGFAISAAGLVLNLLLGVMRGQLPQAVYYGLFAIGAIAVIAGLIIQMRAVGSDRRQ